MHIKKGLFAVALVATVLTAHATGPKLDNKDKVLEKARSAVASNYDNSWKVFAQSAQMVIAKKVALEEAKEWLEASILIKETPYNLELMGDYYYAVGENRQAMDFWVQSIILLKETAIAPNTEELQAKIWKARG